MRYTCWLHGQYYLYCDIWLVIPGCALGLLPKAVLLIVLVVIRLMSVKRGIGW